MQLSRLEYRHREQARSYRGTPTIPTVGAGPARDEAGPGHAVIVAGIPPSRAGSLLQRNTHHSNGGSGPYLRSGRFRPCSYRGWNTAIASRLAPTLVSITYAGWPAAPLWERAGRCSACYDARVGLRVSQLAARSRLAQNRKYTRATNRKISVGWTMTRLLTWVATNDNSPTPMT